MMHGKTIYLLLLSIITMVGILLLQGFWLKQFYAFETLNFERVVNMVFEDALKKEFELRCDIIARDIEHTFMNTDEYDIKSELNTKTGKFEYIILNNKKRTNLLRFSSFELNKPLTAGDTSFKRVLAREYANRIKEEDLKNHFVFYRLENLGVFLSNRVKEIAFDTARLRPVLAQMLQERDILTPFSFYLNYKDSTTNYSKLPEELLRRFPVITRAYPTYKWWEKEEQFVRTMFANPRSYLFAKLKWLIAASAALMLLLAGCIILLFRSWLKEKHDALVKEDFVNNMTHELKTPLATVSAAVEAMSDFDVLSDTAKSRRYLSQSAIELKKLDKLVDDILNSSLYDKNGLQLQKEKLHMVHELESIAESFKHISEKTVNFELTPCHGEIYILADKQYFIQAVSNVIANSIKYSGPIVNIRISCFELDDEVKVSIADNGWGIKKSDLPYLFDKFYRSIRKEHAVKGHGLGLYFSKRIMEMHSGRLYIESAEAKGTTVTFIWNKQKK
ncbi:MAG: HAMP domain-containing sensor histidine kinase [Ferruginibacter sp.]